MARGAEAKEIITKKILETFENSFQYDKEIRIPMEENGEIIQIKCVLTCSKVNVTPNGDTALPGENENKNEINFSEASSEKIHVEPTIEEKETVSRLAQMLNL